LKTLLTNKYTKLALILSVGLYIVAFKNPLRNAVISRIFDDSSYFKLSNEQKRLPGNAISGLKIDESLKATLFASEPEITNPTNIDVDSKGRVWLCEGFNYRSKLNTDKTTRPNGDRIVILEDTDGDGKSDKTKVFYEGNDINAALGIVVLGNKVIVSCAPNIFVFTDENGDDKADKKEILFKGIGGEQHDHAMHSFIFGPDGKLYFCAGNEGGRFEDKDGNVIKDKYGYAMTGKGKLYRQGMIFRCNLDGSELEVIGHNFRNNFEVSVDSYGSLWQSDNDDDGNKSVRINYVMEYGNYGYTDEMTGAGWQGRRINMEKEINRRHWHQNDPGVVPNMLITGSGSPTGILTYEGDLLPVKYRNQIIHTDAGPKVVRAYPTTKDGAGYKATIVNLMEGKDDWFRPSDVCVAPDGSLMVADWYDPGVGGHQRGDLVKGRVYRITVPEKMPYKSPAFDISTPEGAVEALKSPNMSIRYLAFEKIKGYGAKAEKPLSKLLTAGNDRFKARALWLLTKIEGKGKKYLEKAFTDPNEDIRITAIRISRQTEANPIPYLKKLANDPSPQVRREISIALRNLPVSAEAADLWSELALQYDGKDRWYLEALGIGSDKHPNEFFDAWKSKVGENWNTTAGRDIAWRTRSTGALTLLGNIILDPATSSEDVPKYFRSFDFNASDSIIKRNVLLSLLTANGKNQSEIMEMAIPQFSASDLAYSPLLKEKLNVKLAQMKGTYEYLDLVGKFKLKDKTDEIINMILTSDDAKLRDEAMKALYATFGFTYIKDLIASKSAKEKVRLMESTIYIENPEIFAYKKSIILDDALPLEVRKAVINSFSWGWDGQDMLMEDIIKTGKLPKVLEPAVANLLMNSNRSGYREEIGKYIKMPSATPDKPMPSINELAKRSGDVVNGAKMYTRYCLGCHAMNGKGVDFGPGLSEIGSKFGKDGLYLSILLPDAGVSFGYEGYTIKLKSGGGANGIIISETESDIDLKMMGGVINRIKQTNVLEKKKMEKSLMPSGLYASMTEQELVDLVEYLSTLKKSN
jgi:putative membrane-bound dehydrogenase-like protein